MFISVEGGPRAGKGLLILYFASQAWLAGLRPVLSFPAFFPSKKHLKSPILARLEDIIDPNTYEERWGESDCFHGRHEFHTEAESRSMGDRRFRFHFLDWVSQLGKQGSSLMYDTQDYEAVDKRVRTQVVFRVWAVNSFHKKGAPFVYIIRDRTSGAMSIQYAEESELEFLYHHYDTLARASRIDKVS